MSEKLFYKTIDAESRETHLSMTGNNHKTWHVFTDDPYWIARLDKVAELVSEAKQGREYRLQANQVIIRVVPKKIVLSDEQREELRQRMLRVRESTRKKSREGA
jgi:DNA-binding ferritin-like protein